MRSPRLLQMGSEFRDLPSVSNVISPVREIVAIILVEFIAARAFRKNEIVAFGRLEGPAVDAVGEKGELGARAARLGDVVNLGGIAEARRDQHLGPRGMPVLETGRARFGVAADLLGQIPRESAGCRQRRDCRPG